MPSVVVGDEKVDKDTLKANSITSSLNIDEVNFTPVKREIRPVSQNYVFVLNSDKTPLNPIHPGNARKMLSSKKASVFKKYPFTIILHNEEDKKVKEFRLKIDPGSKHTGFTILDSETNVVIWAAELEHRGGAIKNAMERRSKQRRFRRSRKLRYRAAKFLNRMRKKETLYPSVLHRVLVTKTWVKRINCIAPITHISVENAKFDTQKMQNPLIQREEYSRGTLFGYEVKQYLLEKFNYRCVYCGKNEKYLEIEHIIPRSKGGSNRISNLTISCKICNQKKGSKFLEVFLATKPDVLKRIQICLKKNLRDSGIMNNVNYFILNKVLPIFQKDLEIGYGFQTQHNRHKHKFPKKHWIDSACVGISGEDIYLSPEMKPLYIKAVGQGNRQMSYVNKHGIPVRYRTNQKFYFGFQSGDLVKAVVSRGANKGLYFGRIQCRARGQFNITSKKGCFGVTHRNCKLIQKADGYSYFF